VIQGFKEFILRGNVIDLAIAVVIGTAFFALIDAIVTNLVNPFIAALGSPDTGGLAFQLREGMPATTVDIGVIITAIISFLATAAVVYFVFVVPMNKMAERRAAKYGEEPEEVAEDVALLQEIRDLLRNQNRQL